MSKRSHDWNDLLLKSSKFLLFDEFKEMVIVEDDTMLKVIPRLSSINASGYLTTDSQEGKIYKFQRKNKDLILLG